MSGNLDVSFIKAAEFLRDDAEYKVKNSAKMLGPLMTVVLGVIVLLIIMQVMNGYFNMLDSIEE
jgi:type II secretory pathway component PulF